MSYDGLEKQTKNRFPHLNGTTPRDTLFKGAVGPQLREAIENGKARASGWSGVQLQAVAQFITTYVAAVNKMPYNTGIVYDLVPVLAQLKSIIPELPPELAAVARKVRKSAQRE